MDQGVVGTLQTEYHCALPQLLIEDVDERGEILENVEGNKPQRYLLDSPCLGGNLEGNNDVIMEKGIWRRRKIN